VTRSHEDRSSYFLVWMLLLSALPGLVDARQVLEFGNSWGDPVARELQVVLRENGHLIDVVRFPEQLSTKDMLSAAGKSTIKQRLDSYPDAEIIYLSIGANDWFRNWTSDMANTEEEAELFTWILQDIDALCDYIHSLRPDMQILWFLFDFYRPWDVEHYRITLGQPNEVNAAQLRLTTLAAQLAFNNPRLTFEDFTGTLQINFGFDGVLHTDYDPPKAIAPGDASLPDPGLPSPFAAFLPGDVGHLTTEGYRALAVEQYRRFYRPYLDQTPFMINPGLNDAWYSPDTSGQGLFINVFPEIGQIFLAWFTYDVERPDPSMVVTLGEAGHRWLTAQGEYRGDQAILDVYVTRGGTFDSAEPKPENEKDGVIFLDFTDCDEGRATYDIPSIQKQGIVRLQRITRDNVPLCEALNEQLQ
jgi:hypothetical protein